MATNPGEQFFAYTSIVTWTLSQCGINAERPQEVFFYINLKIVIQIAQNLSAFIAGSRL